MALSDAALIRLQERADESDRLRLRSTTVEALVAECLAYRRIREVVQDAAAEGNGIDTDRLLPLLVRLIEMETFE